MKVLICLILMCMIVMPCFALDFYGYFYEEYEVGKEEDVEGTVANVYPNGVVWVVMVYTSRMLEGYYTASPVALLYMERPKVNDGDTIAGKFVYNGCWEIGGYNVPTFRRA